MRVSRRSVLKLGASGLTMATLVAIGSASVPKRLARPVPGRLPAIQFDIGDYIGPVETINGIDFRFGPVFTSFITARLKRTPDGRDQQVLGDALATIEDRYAFSPGGVFTFVSYGLPYFRRLSRRLVAEHMPRLVASPERYALEEAIPSPTDVSNRNRGLQKTHFNVPVMIERNDLLFTLRSDTLAPLLDVYNWLNGVDWLNGQFAPAPAFRGLLDFTSNRLMFAQRGLPRKVAQAHRLPYAGRIPPDSPMWMGFADQQVPGAGPASIVTFQGNEAARFTDTQAGDYSSTGQFSTCPTSSWIWPNGTTRHIPSAFSTCSGRTRSPRLGTPINLSTAAAQRFSPLTFRVATMHCITQRKPRPSKGNGVWDTFRRYIVRPVTRRAHPCISEWTDPGSTTWMSLMEPASRSFSSRSSSRRPTSLRQCGATRQPTTS